MTAPRHDAWRLSEIDAPDGPRKGMQFWVQLGSRWTIGERHTISRVNARSFYVAYNGRSWRYPRADWWRWLRERAEEGPLSLDGHPLRLAADTPGGLLASSSVCAMVSGARPATHRGDRAARIFRAVREVLQRYRIEETDATSTGARRFRVHRRGAEYTVTVQPDWSRLPRCDCPDAVRRGPETPSQLFCKHTVAVLLFTPELRHQLIDLFL